MSSAEQVPLSASLTSSRARSIKNKDVKNACTWPLPSGGASKSACMPARLPVCPCVARGYGGVPRARVRSGPACCPAYHDVRMSECAYVPVGSARQRPSVSPCTDITTRLQESVQLGSPECMRPVRCSHPTCLRGGAVAAAGGAAAARRPRAQAGGRARRHGAAHRLRSRSLSRSLARSLARAGRAPPPGAAAAAAAGRGGAGRDASAGVRA